MATHRGPSEEGEYTPEENAAWFDENMARLAEEQRERGEELYPALTRYEAQTQ